MATKVDLKIATLQGITRSERTYSFVNPETSDANLIRVAKAMAALTTSTYEGAAKVTTVDLVEDANDG